MVSISKGWIKGRTTGLDRFVVFLALLSALGAGLVLAREVAYGAVLLWDSIYYISLARNLLAGEGFVNMSGTANAHFPPLYPLLLAGSSFGLLDPRDVAGPSNAAVFALTIFCLGLYLRRHLASRLLALCACLAVALSMPLVDMAWRALSDTLFILLATLALTRIDRFLTEGHSASLLWSAAFSALAWHSRYIGVAVPMVVGLLLVFQHGASLPQRARRSAVFSILAAAPMALWRSLMPTWFGLRIGPATRPTPTAAPSCVNPQAWCEWRIWRMAPFSRWIGGLPAALP